MTGKAVEDVGPFFVFGHSVRGFVQSGGVTSGGVAIPSNAHWIVELDNAIQIPAGLEAHVDDTEELVRTRITDAVRQYLNPSERHSTRDS